MNYACLDARVLSNTSAIIIETIEKTMPDGSIMRQREGGELDPDAPLPAPLTEPPHTWKGDLSRSPSGALPCHVENAYL